MTLYDSYFETICDDVASKTVTFTGCEKSHLMCNVALIHFPSAKSTQVRKIWKGDANLNLLKKFHKQKSPLRRRYLRRPMAVLFHSKTLSSSNGRQPQLRSSNFPLGIFSVPCCPNDNKKERIGLAESREIERTYIEHIKCCGYHLSSTTFVDDEEPFAARGKIPMLIFICGTLLRVEPFNQKMINTDSGSDGTKALTLTFHWYYLWQVYKHKNAFLNGNRHFPQPRQLLLLLQLQDSAHKMVLVKRFRIDSYGQLSRKCF